MMNMRRGFVTLAGSLLVLGGMSVATSQSASATPSGCTFTGHNGGTTASAKCTSGSGRFRVWVNCVDELRGSGSEFDGPWTNIGGTSKVTCPREGGVQWDIQGGGIDVSL
ncbi:MAG: hypothetical protein ACR2N4_04760 [Jatrophihabitans sp.]